jgi:hypothetical protein
MGLAKKIKKLIFEICRTKFPSACIFSITKSPAVKKMNLALGFKEVNYTELTTDPKFWKGCETCPHYPELLENEMKACQCMGMLFKP